MWNRKRNNPHKESDDRSYKRVQSHYPRQGGDRSQSRGRGERGDSYRGQSHGRPRDYHHNQRAGPNDADGGYGRRRPHPKGLSLMKLVNKGYNYDDKEEREKAFKERSLRWKKYQKLLEKEGVIDRGTRVSTSDEAMALKLDKFGRKMRKRKYKGKGKSGDDDSGSDNDDDGETASDYEDGDGDDSGDDSRKPKLRSASDEFKYHNPKFGKYERFASRATPDLEEALRQQEAIEAEERAELLKYDLIKEEVKRDKPEGVEEARARRKLGLRELHKVVKTEQWQAQKVKQEEHKNRKLQVKESIHRRQLETQRLRERTKTGQPIMKNVVLNVLDKLQRRFGNE